MPQSLARVYLHIVFSTKGRTPWLQDATVRSELYAYMATILRDNVDSPAIRIDGVEDHVHALLTLSRSMEPVRHHLAVPNAVLLSTLLTQIYSPALKIGGSTRNINTRSQSINDLSDSHPSMVPRTPSNMFPLHAQAHW